MNLDQITPLVLTYNEAPNIARTLGRLSWAKKVIVVDSLSEDDTRSIARRFPNAQVFERRFDRHEAQWNFGLRETGLSSEWVLALDADYCLGEDFVDELKGLDPPSEVSAYYARFRYRIAGKVLRASVYPPVAVLFRRDRCQYRQDGHTQKLQVEGRTRFLRSPIEHDDRKPFARWWRAQHRYMRLEAQKLAGTRWRSLGGPDRLRKLVVLAPPAMFVYCLFAKALILDGVPGLFYSFQRTLAETLLSVYLLRRYTASILGKHP